MSTLGTPAASETEEEQPKKKVKPRAALTADQKRVNHLESEKKRRDMIKDSFKQLVDIVTAGQAESGISILGEESESSEEEVKGKKKKGKTAGRGRRGEVFSGATKNRFIEQAIKYVEWIKEDTARLELQVLQAERAVGLGGLSRV